MWHSWMISNLNSEYNMLQTRLHVQHYPDGKKSCFCDPENSDIKLRIMIYDFIF